jgi:multiple sugar transport system substrate-binding protein
VETDMPTNDCRPRTAQCPSPNAWRLLATAAFLLLTAGCGSSPPTEATAERPLEGVKLRLLVVGDAEIAAAAGRLQGEWTAQTGAEYQVSQLSEKDLETAASLDADAIICPAYQLGPLAERKLIVRLPENVLDDAGRQWTDVFELLRLREAAWGGEPLGVPFGSPVLVCYYRADLLKKLGRKPPRTWAEYQRLAELLANRKNLGDAAPPDGQPWCGAMEPLGPGWAGLTLLARAAPYAKHHSNYSTLFDIKSMEPLIARPPFVQALQELAAASKQGLPEQLQADPAAVRAAFWQGRCGMALTWPSAATAAVPVLAPAKTGLSPSESQVGFVELPGSAKVFDLGRSAWDTRGEDQDPHVPLLTISGRMGAVSAKSDQPEATARLLLWLAGDQLSTQICAVSPATTLFRHAQAKSPRTWVEPPVPAAAAAQYAAATEQTFGRKEWLAALPIPGRAEYLAALDKAVHDAVSGKQVPIMALDEAADEWERITKAREGEEQRKQHKAYLHSLGMTD